MFYQFSPILSYVQFFFFNDTATTEIYTLSLHDALPISDHRIGIAVYRGIEDITAMHIAIDRKSTRLNSSHQKTSYAVFCLKKKNDLLSHPTIAHTTTTHQFKSTCFVHV